LPQAVVIVRTSGSSDGFEDNKHRDLRQAGRIKAMTRITRLFGVWFVLLALGCASGVSGQARSEVTYRGSFVELQKAPEKYQGEVVMFGGKVIETKTEASLSEIVVLQLPLGGNDRPEDTDRSEGRYLIRSDQFLDPAIYQKDGLLTVVGRLSGAEVRSIGGFQYTYPVVQAIEIKPWERREKTSPGVHVGIGVGTSF
jgi:outer membrane lipoprotein